MGGDDPLLDDGVDCTIDACNELNGQVTHTPDNEACSDNNFCNGTEVCTPLGGCQDGTPPQIDDGIECTEDSCNQQTGQILHVEQDDQCDNDNVCDGAEQCVEGQGCVVGEDPEDGTVCDDSPRSICLRSRCEVSECGDDFVDEENDEECDDGNRLNDDGCDSDCTTSEGPEMEGNFSISSDPIAYRCVFMDIITLIDFNITSFGFGESGNSLLVTGAPTNMTQTPMPSGSQFSATGQIPGGCTEIYTLSGTFSGPGNYTGTFTLRLSGDDCYACNEATFNVVCENFTCHQ